FVIGRGREREQAHATQAESLGGTLLYEAQKLCQLPVTPRGLAYARDDIAEESGLLLEELSEPSVEPAPQRGRDEREHENHQRLDRAGPESITGSRPKRERAYAVEVDDQNDGGERGDDEALFEYEFEVAVAVDVIREQRGRQKRAEVCKRLEVLAERRALA